MHDGIEINEERVKERTYSVCIHAWQRPSTQELGFDSGLGPFPACLTLFSLAGFLSLSLSPTVLTKIKAPKNIWRKEKSRQVLGEELWRGLLYPRLSHVTHTAGFLRLTRGGWFYVCQQVSDAQGRYATPRLGGRAGDEAGSCCFPSRIQEVSEKEHLLWQLNHLTFTSPNLPPQSSTLPPTDPLTMQPTALVCVCVCVLSVVVKSLCVSSL